MRAIIFWISAAVLYFGTIFTATYIAVKILDVIWEVMFG